MKAVWLPLGFGAMLVGLIGAGWLSVYGGWLYGVASLLCFGLYAWDKSAARRGAWRVSERTLHGWALVGGWPGAMLAQAILRHKTVKPAFRRLYRATILINLVLLLAYVSRMLPPGKLP